MTFNLAEFNWTLILIIVALSATVSYVGDILGMKIGKKRISLFGLRPKYTSTVITLVTGVGVAILTLIVAATTSDSVRDAFFGVNYLERQITQLINDQHDRQDQLDRMEMELTFSKQQLETTEAGLLAASRDLAAASDKLEVTERQATELNAEHTKLTTQLKRLNEEKERMEKVVAQLRSDTEQLRHGLTEMREGRVIAFQGEMLAQVAVRDGASKMDIDAVFLKLIQTAGDTLMARAREQGGADFVPKVAISENVRAAATKKLLEKKGRKLLRMTAEINIVQGQVVNGLVDVFDSKIIFRENDVLMKESIQGGMSGESASDLLYTMLKQINRRAVEQGVLPDPITGAVGNLDSLEFYEVVDRLSGSNDGLEITFAAAEDIYTEGPVRIRIDVKDI